MFGRRPRGRGSAPPRDASGETTVRGAASYEEYQRTGNVQLLQTAITCFREAVEATPVGHPGRPRCLSNLGAALYEEYKRTGNVQLLQSIIIRLTEAVEAAPADHPKRTEYLSNLAIALQARFERTGQLVDLDQAITRLSEAVEVTPADHPKRTEYLSDLGDGLRARFERTGQLVDLDQAITRLSEAVETTPADHPDRFRYLSVLGLVFWVRFERTGQLVDLDQAITRLSEAVETTPADHPDRFRCLSNLGAGLRTRYALNGQRADLDEAITRLSEAVETTPADHLDRPECLSNLGAGLRTRYALNGQRADLDEAITVWREAVDTTPTDHSDRPARLSSLGGAFGTRYGQDGQRADLDEAISLGRQAVDASPAEHPDRPMFLSNLGDALRIRYALDGQRPDLDEAISLGRQAVTTMPTGRSAYEYLVTLGAALALRYEREGQRADLDEAISLGRQAADTAPDLALGRSTQASNLGIMLRARYNRDGQRADLDEAITVSREAVDTTPVQHPDRPARLSNLGAALHARYDRDGQRADLDEAITVSREAVDTTPSGHPARPVCLSNLGLELWARFKLTGQRADLDEAITVSREAVDTSPAKQPDSPRRLSILGDTLHARYEREGTRVDLDEAIRLRQEGARAVTGLPARRLIAAQAWGRWLVEAGDPTAALEAYELAVEQLLPLVAWHGLDQATREHHLREWPGLASDAAAAAVAAGDPARAVELLEAGRSMLWTQALRLRQDLAVLKERAPGLTAALNRARRILNTSTGTSDGSDTVGDVRRGQVTERQMLDQRRLAARDWDDAVDQIRRIEGFEHFLRPVPFTDLRQAAAGGPVAIVNISRHGSHALIVTKAESGPDPGVHVVDLPAAPRNTVTDQANTLLGAGDRHAVFEVLAWTWQAITEPVLTALGHTHTPSGEIEDWPRVWWCPTGPAMVLPLHASGRHPRTRHEYMVMGEAAAVGDSVAGRVVSSYTPTLTALIRARARPSPRRVRQLAVGVQDAPGQTHLRAVPAELQVVASYLPEPTRATHLLGAAATRQAVLDALPAHPWLHLSCHGIQHPVDASRSAFFLDDRPLTLADLAALNLREVDLAYLAACQTATGDIRLLDEALHLAAALQLVGYRHVLATLWSISDDAAPAMADAVYAHLLHPDPGHPDPADRPDSARAPYALHRAVTHLRQTCAGEPLLWAPYIHLGP